MVGTKPNTKEPCSCCGRAVLERTAVVCSKCGKQYHKSCFLRDSGVEPEDGTNCICCLCPPLPAKIPMAVKARSRYADEFLRKGFCVIPLPPVFGGERTLDVLHRWNAEANRMFRGFRHAYECQAMGGQSGVPSLDGGYSNFRRRCEGRFEMLSDEITNCATSLMEKCDEIQKALRVLLSTQKKQMSSGCFYSVHGSENQNFHTDGPALSDVVDMYPYAINVFIPLVPVDKRNGTEFIPGTQRASFVGSKDGGKSCTERPSVPLGNAMLFDYRVVHRGLANITTTPRPCYYVTYSRRWYTDKRNFSEQRYKRRLEVAPAFIETREERARRRLESKAEDRVFMTE